MTIIEMIKHLAQRNSVVASADVLAVFAELEAIQADAAEVFKEIGNELGCNPDNESIMMAIDELKKRLATPVRLPPVQHREFLGLKIDSMDAEQVRISIRAAGFTVDGDDQ